MHELTFSVQEEAQIVDVETRESNSCLRRTRTLGLIDYNAGIEIHNSLLNVVLRDQPQIRRWCGLPEFDKRRLTIAVFVALDRVLIDRARILELNL